MGWICDHLQDEIRNYIRKRGSTGFLDFFFCQLWRDSKMATGETGTWLGNVRDPAEWCDSECSSSRKSQLLVLLPRAFGWMKLPYHMPCQKTWYRRCAGHFCFTEMPRALLFISGWPPCLKIRSSSSGHVGNAISLVSIEHSNMSEKEIKWALRSLKQDAPMRCW